jgi:hypothetical protein
MSVTTFGKRAGPCDDCWDGHCTMNCGPRVSTDPHLAAAERLQRFLLDRNIWLTDAEALAGVAAVEGRT